MCSGKIRFDSAIDWIRNIPAQVCQASRGCCITLTDIESFQAAVKQRFPFSDIDFPNDAHAIWTRPVTGRRLRGPKATVAIIIADVELVDDRLAARQLAVTFDLDS